MAAFYEQMLPILQKPMVKNGEWQGLPCQPAWDGNGSWDAFIAHSWRGTEGERMLIAVNYAPHSSQCYLILPFPEITNRSVQLRDLLSSACYIREAHLHTHTEFSLLDGLGKITDLVDEAGVQGFDSLAITDHGALYGAVAFYKAARARDIKPIIGVETYVARRSMGEKEGKADAQPFHLILLASDLVGYRNLCRLVTDAHLDGYYYKPRIDREHLAKYSEGLIGLSACLNGEVSRALEVDDWDLARNLAGEYGDIFGKDRFFLELQDHGMPEQRRLNEQLLRLAPETGLPLVVTNDLHYVRRSQADAHDVLLCVGTGSNIDTPGRMKMDSDNLYLKSAAEMAALFPDQREALLNTRRIAEMCDLTLPLGQLHIPHFPVPDGETVKSWLRKECEKGLAWRYGTVTPELRTRLDYELGVIISMGYAGYFLIVADFIRYRPRAGDPDDVPGQRAGIDRDLHPRDHAGRPDRLRPALRAVPQPRSRDDAGHRRRLPGRPPGRGHRLRLAQVRPGPRRPDHHLRHDARPSRDPRRRSRPRPLLR